MCGAPTETHPVIGKRLNRRQGHRPHRLKGFTVSVCRCSQCDLVYADPMPHPASLEQHYGINPDTYWKPTYFQNGASVLEMALPAMERVRKNRTRPRALDIGAGVGKALEVFEAQGFDAYGLEPSSTFVHHALHTLHVPPEKLMHASLETAELPQGYFDFIYMGAVFEHLYDPDAALQRVFGWLAPGGIIYIEVPNSRWLIAQAADMLYRLRGMDYTIHLCPAHAPYHTYEFGLQTFEQNAKRRGYHIVHSQFFPGPTYLPKFLDFILRPFMYRTQTSMQLAVWLSHGPIEGV